MNDLFDFTPKVPRFAVFGNPVAHSKSPQIHQLFAQQFGLRIEYTTTLAEPGGFAQAVEHFQASGGVGLNVTVPFKVDAWKLADVLTDRAALANAVNTLWFEDAVIHGDNTDGIGLVRDIRDNLNQAISDQRVLLIGAGGAVRGVLGPLLAESPAQVVLVNRTEDKALDLADQFGHLGTIKGGSLRSAKGQSFDLIINGTATSLTGELPDIDHRIFSGAKLAYDMMYAKQPTLFMQLARSNGTAKTADGLGMLVEQAAESFFIWNRQHPATQPVIQTLRQDY